MPHRARLAAPLCHLTIDVLTLQSDGRVSDVWVLGDEIGLLVGLEALSLSAAFTPASAPAE